MTRGMHPEPHLIPTSPTGPGGAYLEVRKCPILKGKIFNNLTDFLTFKGMLHFVLFLSYYYLLITVLLI